MDDRSKDSRLVALKDINLHVDDYGGEGRPVILIHGWPLSGESWSMQIDALLEAGHRVITYDRRGFGRSDKAADDYGYDALAQDVHGLIDELELDDVTLVGFSMGGGEVARYIAKYGEDKLHSVVFAAAVPPMMLKTDDNPDGPLEESVASEMRDGLSEDPDAFFEQFTTAFFSADADGKVLVPEDVRLDAVRLCKQADMTAALEAMQSFATTDFRQDLPKITVPTLVIHGDADGTVPFEGSGERIHETVAHSELHIIPGGPHGINASHADEFNEALVSFLAK